MTIGDRLYYDGSLTYPIKNHPDAPFTDAIGNVLRQAYIHAVHASRLLITQSYGFDLSNPETDSGIKRTFALATDVGIARGYADIPREATHLRASVFFAVLAPSKATVTHTIFVTGSPDINSETFLTPILVDPTRANQTDQARLRVEFPFSDRFRTHRAEVCVEITSGLPATQEIRVLAHALGTDSGELLDYQPLYISVWWEHRG